MPVVQPESPKNKKGKGKGGGLSTPFGKIINTMLILWVMGLLKIPL